MVTVHLTIVSFQNRHEMSTLLKWESSAPLPKKSIIQGKRTQYVIHKPTLKLCNPPALTSKKSLHINKKKPTEKGGTPSAQPLITLHLQALLEG